MVVKSRAAHWQTICVLFLKGATYNTSKSLVVEAGSGSTQIGGSGTENGSIWVEEADEENGSNTVIWKRKQEADAPHNGCFRITD